jgi:predicted choloylglycine hydrolase
MRFSLGAANECLHTSILLLVFCSSLMIVSGSPADACTIVVKADSESVLVGNNEDFLEPRTKVWFLARTDSAYGRMIWGYDRYLYPYQGGMNERGLFIDINAIGFSGWRNDPEKADLTEDIVDYVLSKCATVDEVIAEFDANDIDLGWVKYVVADATGSSAILEWLNGGLHIVRREGDYQISTNYLSPEEPTEPRYQISDHILSSQPHPSVDLIRKVLAATSYDVDLAQTVYSTICDLKKRKVFLYNFHFFEEVVVFDVAAELAEGNHSFEISSLFEVSTHNEHWFNHLGTLMGARDLMRVIDEKGIEAGAEAFREMAEQKRTFHRYYFPEWSMRSTGLQYLDAGQIENAIGIFRLTTQEYPDSWQAFADLAMAYDKSGDRGNAILNYEKALSMNPEKTEIVETLREMRNETH